MLVNSLSLHESWWLMSSKEKVYVALADWRDIWYFLSYQIRVRLFRGLIITDFVWIFIILFFCCMMIDFLFYSDSFWRLVCVCSSTVKDLHMRMFVGFLFKSLNSVQSPNTRWLKCTWNLVFTMYLEFCQIRVKGVIITDFVWIIIILFFFAFAIAIAISAWWLIFCFEQLFIYVR